MRLLSFVSLTSLAFLINPGNILAASVLSSVAISSQSPSAVVPGSNATYTVTVSRTDNGNLDAYLSVSGLPAGATASFSPAMVHFSGSTPTSGTAALTISTDASLASCSNSFTVTATEGGSSNQKSCAGSLMLACAPKAQSILSCGVLPDGSFQLVCNGSPYQACLIQAATNLIAPTWSTIGTNTADGNGILSFIDADAKIYQARFYRTAAY